MAIAETRTGREPRAASVARDIHISVLLLARRSLDQLEEICRTEDLTHSQYVALRTLCLADDPETGIPASAIADGLLDRASKAGLAERLPNPADRRGVLVRATAEGHRRFAALTPRLQAFHATQWSNLTSAEARQFSHLLATALWGSGEP